MQFSVFKKLSDALKNNESRYFGEILDENFDEIEDLSNGDEVNIYHIFASSIIHEKYFSQFLDKLNQVIIKKFSKKAIEVLLNTASTAGEKQTPLHQAIVQGKAVKTT